MVNAHTTTADAVAALHESAADLTFDNSDDMAALTLSRKTTAAEALIETGRLAMELIGGTSYGAAPALQMHLRDLLGSQFHPLPRSKQLESQGGPCAAYLRWVHQLTGQKFDPSVEFCPGCR